MNSQLDELLCMRYPAIFSRRNGAPETTAMSSGFACGDGWFELIDTLCACLQSETDRNNAPQIVASQVKEKFGELRFYVAGEAFCSQRQLGMIAFATAMSRRICEKCGSPGMVYEAQHSMMARCSEHAPPGAVPESARGTAFRSVGC